MKSSLRLFQRNCLALGFSLLGCGAQEVAPPPQTTLAVTQPASIPVPKPPEPTWIKPELSPLPPKVPPEIPNTTIHIGPATEPSSVFVVPKEVLVASPLDDLSKAELCTKVVQKITDCQEDQDFQSGLFQEYSKVASYNGWPKAKSAMKSLKLTYLSNGVTYVCREWMGDVDFFPAFTKKDKLRLMAEASAGSCGTFGDELGKDRAGSPWFIFDFITDSE